MIKTIQVILPVHVKKFFLYEYSGYEKKNGVSEIHIDKTSEMGKLVDLATRTITHTQKIIEPCKDTLSIRYYTHLQSQDVPNLKLLLLAFSMEAIFKRTLISEVRGGHELMDGNYGPLVAEFLKSRGIERDIDVDFQTMRKVYRDGVAKINRKQAKSYA